ncbi:unnamed protein product [Vicia faba]|uniref:Uncharacterized protein n=1 Tax=Vicia faba TaxID=3906 RepID=A0AAV1AWV0_VICFA|nr:unnamed protein product [Vicia faba]
MAGGRRFDDDGLMDFLALSWAGFGPMLVMALGICLTGLMLRQAITGWVVFDGGQQVIWFVVRLFVYLVLTGFRFMLRRGLYVYAGDKRLQQASNCISSNWVLSLWLTSHTIQSELVIGGGDIFCLCLAKMSCMLLI